MLWFIQSLVSLVFIFFGIGMFVAAFKPRINTILAVIIGVLLIIVGGYILPKQDLDEPDIYYRK